MSLLSIENKYCSLITVRYKIIHLNHLEMMCITQHRYVTLNFEKGLLPEKI